jgi:hypothetical protein
MILNVLISWWNRKPRAGDRWTDASGNIHILTAHDEDGSMTADGAVL